MNNIQWERRYLFIQTDSNANKGRLTISLGLNDQSNSIFNSSTNPLGVRYFTDLRLVKVESLVGSVPLEYINSLKLEN